METILDAQAKAQDVPLPSLITLFLPWTPHVDGVELTDQPINLFASGMYNRGVPVMIGDVGAEGRIFVFSAFNTPLDYTEYEVVLDAFFRTDVADKVWTVDHVIDRLGRPAMSCLSSYTLVLGHRQSVLSDFILGLQLMVFYRSDVIMHSMIGISFAPLFLLTYFTFRSRLNTTQRRSPDMTTASQLPTLRRTYNTYWIPTAIIIIPITLPTLCLLTDLPTGPIYYGSNALLSDSLFICPNHNISIFLTYVRPLARPYPGDPLMVCFSMGLQHTDMHSPMLPMSLYGRPTPTAMDTPAMV